MKPSPKRWMRLWTILFMWLLSFCTIFSKDITLLNSSFEEADEKTRHLESWVYDEWRQEETSNFSVHKGDAKSGNYFVSITHLVENDSRLIQKIKVEPKGSYELSAWVRASNIPEGHIGANLSILESDSIPDHVIDTKGEWQYLTHRFTTDEDTTEVTVALRLGFYGNTTEGMVAFDDVKIKQIDYAVPKNDGNFYNMSGLIMFFMTLIFIGVGIIVKKKRLHIDNHENIKNGNMKFYPIVLILLGAIIIRLFLMQEEGYSVDIRCFKSWAIHAATSLTNFYSGEIFADYPPGYIYVLWVIGQIRQFLSLPFESTAFLYLIKLPAVIADMITICFIYKIASIRLNQRTGLALALIYALNPAIYINSAMWGQVDAIFTLILVLSLYAMIEGRLTKGTIWYVLAVLFKPQALLVAPLYLFIFIEERSVKVLIKNVMVGLLSFIVIILPFAIHQQPLWIFHQYTKTLGSYPYASLNAFNLYTLFGGNWAAIQDKFFIFSYGIWGYAFLIVTIILAGYMYFKNKERAKIIYIATFIYASAFVTSIKMHERYLFPVILMVLVTFIWTKRKIFYHLFLAFSITHFINVAFVLYDPSMQSIFIVYVISGLHVLLLILLTKELLKPSTNDVDRITKIMDKFKNMIGKLGIQQNTDNKTEYFESKEQSRIGVQQQNRKMAVKDFMFMFLIMIVYGTIAFINLGDRQAPQTFYSSPNGEGAYYIDFGEIKRVESMTYYTGADNGGRLYLSFSLDGKTWERVSSIDISSVFAWKKQFLGQKGRFVAVKLEGPCTIGELAFYENHNQQPIPIREIKASKKENNDSGRNMVDEQSIAVFMPSFQNSTYFDEIYFARTGYEYLKGSTFYESTHPPLGKLIISTGIALFGMTPFGWRFMGTLFGIVMIGIFYSFAKKLFGKTLYAALAAIIIAVDGMHFVQTRIATVDGFLVFFIILMYYYMYDFTQKMKRKDKGTKSSLFFSGFFFACGVATKWSAIYGGIGLAIIYFYTWTIRYIETKKKNSHEAKKVVLSCFLWGSLFFVMIPAGIYLLTYLPELMIKGKTGDLMDIIKAQSHMYRYHSQLVSQHPFASSPLTWPFLIKPVWYYMGRDGVSEGYISSIVLLGNPLIWWSGIIALCYTFYDTLTTKNRNGLFLLIAYFSQFIPYFFIRRQMFLYHYFPSLVFLMLIIVHSFTLMVKKWGENKTRKRILLYAGSIMGIFALFYPILSGTVISRTFAEHFLRWMNQWIFM